jgi:hypothetical protein
MKMVSDGQGGVVLQGVDSPVAEWLDALVDPAELENEWAAERLFPSPDLTGEAADLEDDWKAHVVPGLIEQFREARQMVAIDLHRMKSTTPARRLRIPRNHFDGWISALNQSRLVLVAAHQLDETVLAKPPTMSMEPTFRNLLLKLHFYGVLQELLLEAGWDE